MRLKLLRYETEKNRKTGYPPLIASLQNVPQYTFVQYDLNSSNVAFSKHSFFKLFEIYLHSCETFTVAERF